MHEPSSEPALTRDPAERMLLQWLDALEQSRDAGPLLTALADEAAVRTTLATTEPGPPQNLRVGQHLRLVDALTVVALRGGQLGDTALTVALHCHAEIAKLAPADQPLAEAVRGVPAGLTRDNLDRKTPYHFGREQAALQKWRDAPADAALWRGAAVMAARLIGYMRPLVHHQQTPDLQTIAELSDDPLFWLDDDAPPQIAAWLALYARLYPQFVDARGFDCERAEADVVAHARRPAQQLAARRAFLVEALPHAPSTITIDAPRFLARLA